MSYLPISLDLTDRPVLVVGGGAIAQQKVEVLLANGARVRVVAPAVRAALRGLAGIELRERHFRPSDLAGIGLVIAATDDPALNRRVRELAHRRGLLVNVVDVPALCDFIFPSIMRRGDVTVAVSTGGASPSLARLLRQDLESSLGPSLGDAVAAVGRSRRELRSAIPCAGARRAAAETLARIALAARQTPEVDVTALMRAFTTALAAVAARERRPDPMPNQAAAGRARREAEAL